MIISKADKNSLKMAEGLHFKGLSLNPTEKREEIIELLRQAHEILKAPNNIQEEECLARICNSLAENLSYSETQKEEAETLFHKSIEIKSKSEINDKPGISRSNGGLGRLCFFSGDISKLEDAEKYLKEDLKISEDLGDLRGQTEMKSLLGACCLKRKQYSESYSLYVESLNFAKLGGSDIGIEFAIEGLLNCYKHLTDSLQKKCKKLIKPYSGKEYGNEIQEKIDKILKK